MYFSDEGSKPFDGGKFYLSLDGSLYRLENNYACEADGDGPNENDMVEQKDNVLMQFTGLHDKNGKEIYEGDVLSATCRNFSGTCTVEWVQEPVRYDHEHPYEGLNGFVQWGKWSQKAIGGGLTPAMQEGHFEIIGNIYENPELLK